MFATYVAVTLLASTLNGSAAFADLAGTDYAKAQADLNRVPHSWVRPLGVLLGAGAVGLLTGFAVPLLGALAAAGLVLYFLGAFGAHVRAHNYRLGAWALYFGTALAALGVGLWRVGNA
jgi:hypothetical protein